MNGFFYLKAKKAVNFSTWFQICRINFINRFLIHAIVHKLSSSGHDMNSLNNFSTINGKSVNKNELYWSGIPMEKISATLTNDERKHSFW